MKETDTAVKTKTEALDEVAIYEIRIKGHLNERWANWFDEMTITLEDNGDTLLSGPVADQAALYGLLRKVRNLGMPLRSVICVKPGEADDFNTKQ